VPENLAASVARAEALRPLLPEGVSMAEMALRFVISNPDVSTVIPGMRRAGHVDSNIAASEAGPSRGAGDQAPGTPLGPEADEVEPVTVDRNSAVQLPLRWKRLG